MPINNRRNYFGGIFIRLVDNGLDSFKKSITILGNIEGIAPEQYEYTLKELIITLHHSTETLFKNIIKEANEYLIYTNFDELCEADVLKKIKSNKRKEFTVKTIVYIEAINRAIFLKNLKINKLEYKYLDTLNRYRNALTHYEHSFDRNEVEHVVAYLLPFLYKNYNENINEFERFAIAEERALWNFKRFFD